MQKTWKVAPLGGGPERHFASKSAAFAFAQTQSQMSWHQSPWTIVHKPTGDRHHITHDGKTPPCCGRTH